MTDPLLTAKAGRIDQITVPPRRYFAIEGQGAPESPAHAQAVQALYPLAYAARFAGKAQGHTDKVGPLQGLWWADDMADFLTDTRDRWRWCMMIRMPDWLDADGFAALRDRVIATKGGGALARVAPLTLHEGPCLQTLHVGPYADEGPTIRRLHEHAAALGMALRGRHHEIYLSDPRRGDPARLRTILRQPVGPR